MKSLWETEDFLDVTIACDDDQIDAHKVILSAASPFFQNILKRNPHSHPLLYLRGTKKKDILSLLDFIYSGETQVSHEDLVDFMALANSLQVKGLVGEEMGMNEITNTEDALVEKEAAMDEIWINPNLSGKVKKEKTKARNKMLPDTRNKEDTVEVSEDISEMKSDIAVTVEKYGSNINSEADDSFQFHDVSNTSVSEYDERVSELVEKSELGWICSACPYKAKLKGHVREHVQEHIEGYSHECKYCEKSFSMKRTLRRHVPKCKASHVVVSIS